MPYWISPLTRHSVVVQLQGRESGPSVGGRAVLVALLVQAAVATAAAADDDLTVVVSSGGIPEGLWQRSQLKK
jgi:hypothetical protein